jgi:hypothetical protein
MSSWEQTYDSVFFLSIGTLFFGFMTATLGYCLKSKCESFSVLLRIDKCPTKSRFRSSRRNETNGD